MSSFVRCVGLLLSVFVFAGCQPASIETLLNEAEAKGLAKIVRIGKKDAPVMIEVEALEDLDPKILEAISSKKYLIRVTGGKPTILTGLLSLDGNLWIINPNGIIVGPKPPSMWPIRYCHRIPGPQRIPDPQ